MIHGDPTGQLPAPLQTGCLGVPAAGGHKELDVCEQPNRLTPPGPSSLDRGGGHSVPLSYVGCNGDTSSQPSGIGKFKWFSGGERTRKIAKCQTRCEATQRLLG